MQQTERKYFNTSYRFPVRVHMPVNTAGQGAGLSLEFERSQVVADAHNSLLKPVDRRFADAEVLSVHAARPATAPSSNDNSLSASIDASYLGASMS